MQQVAWDNAYVNGTIAAAGYALNATAAAGSMHLMLTHLPNCFTVGANLLFLLPLCYVMRGKSLPWSSLHPHMITCIWRKP